ncbi:MAG: hypothetical protein JWM95_1698 [Gemmatimonadetes bacterium]|nr:hypothetical protein [Gemmatimonadota bacterium]
MEAHNQNAPAAKPVVDEAKADIPVETTTEKKAAASNTAVGPVATSTDAAHTFRTDLGESLPPQKPAGVE